MPPINVVKEINSKVYTYLRRNTDTTQIYNNNTDYIQTSWGQSVWSLQVEKPVVYPVSVQVHWIVSSDHHSRHWHNNTQEDEEIGPKP